MKASIVFFLVILFAYSGQCQEVERQKLVTVSLGPKFQNSKNYIVGLHNRVDFRLNSKSFIGLGYHYYNNQAMRSSTSEGFGSILPARTEISDQFSHRLFAYYKFYYTRPKHPDVKFQFFSYLGFGIISSSFTLIKETLVPTSSPEYSKTISTHEHKGSGGLFSFGVEYELPKGKLFMETIFICDFKKGQGASVEDSSGLDMDFLLQLGYQISF